MGACLSRLIQTFRRGAQSRACERRCQLDSLREEIVHLTRQLADGRRMFEQQLADGRRMFEQRLAVSQRRFEQELIDVRYERFMAERVRMFARTVHRRTCRDEAYERF